jgi:F420-non-reducing hydrogenase small subunit
MNDKPKVAICWLGACGGCDEALVDLNETLLQLAETVDIVLWPVAMDFKYSHIRSMKDRAILLSVITGSVRNSEHQELAELLRSKSELVLSFGACASHGGTPGLANFRTSEDILNWVYREAPTIVNPEGTLPQTQTQVNGKTLTLPELFDHVYTLDQVIDVDYYLPGCPPPPDSIAVAINAVVSGDLPPKGSTLAPRRALCETCPRNTTKPYRLEIEKVRRIHEIEADPEHCFLPQGIICMGPATRSGCGESCIKINMPCRGCFGPVPGVIDHGSRFLSAFATLIKTDVDADSKEAMAAIPDPAGYFYRFSQASSTLGRRKLEKPKEE